jgi:hypothetical protein
MSGALAGVRDAVLDKTQHRFAPWALQVWGWSRHGVSELRIVYECIRKLCDDSPRPVKVLGIDEKCTVEAGPVILHGGRRSQLDQLLV